MQYTYLVSGAHSPESRERTVGTLEWTFTAGAAPTVSTGHTVTRLRPFSFANAHAAFSKSTFDTGYAYDSNGLHRFQWMIVFVRNWLCRTCVFVYLPSHWVCWF